jgi:UDP-glucose 4-epimerase
VRVFVTGSSGYIGSHLVKRLSGHEVFTCDLKEQDNICFPRKIEADVAFHLAAFKSVPESVANPLKYYRNNIDALIGLLESFSGHVIFSSSACVYGDGPFTEDSPTKVVNPYGHTKVICEDILKTRGNYTILRYFNPYGKGGSDNLIPIVEKSEKVQIFGGDYDTPDGTCQRDFIHIDDLIEGHVMAMNWKNMTVNLGTGKPTSVLEVVKAYNKPYEIVGRRAGDVSVSCANIDLARSLGFSPKYPEFTI